MQESRIEGFRLSPQQKRFWMLQRQVAGFPDRAECTILIDGKLDRDILTAALNDVIDRHEILRTEFHYLPGMTIPVQVVTNGYRPKILCDDPRAKASSPVRVSLRELSSGLHAMTVSMPSLCADAVTLKRLMQLIAQSYKASLRGEALIDEPSQYIVVSEWLFDLLESDDAEAGREYWKRKSASDLMTLNLPFEARPSEEAFKPRTFETVLSEDMTRRLGDAVEKYDTTVAVWLLACWATLLWRLTGSSESVVGVYCDGRTDEELEWILGPLAKYLPVQSHIEGQVRFNELVERLGEALNEAYGWQECFSWEQNGSLRSGDENLPFLPFCFEYEEWPEQLSAGDIKFSLHKLSACIDRFKLKLSCAHKGDALVVHFAYDSTRLSEDSVERLAEEFETVLRSSIANPQSAISHLEFVGYKEREQVLVKWNDTKIDYSGELLLPELFRKQVERTPDGCAVTFGHQHLTYRQLDTLSDNLAGWLSSNGVGAESLVGVCMQRSLEMVVCLLGVLKAGAAYLCIDPSYPPDRVAYMIEDSGAGLVLTQHQYLDQLPAGCRPVCVDSQWAEVTAGASAGVGGEISLDSPAYVIYTSGSTGRPKGVVVTHRGISNHMRWMQERFPLTERDAVLQKTTTSFDASVWEFYAPLLAGGKLVMAREGGQRDGGYLIEEMERQGVTVLQVVPAQLRMLVEEGGLSRCKVLRRVYSGGEELSRELVRRVKEEVEAEVVNLYGPTEATIDASYSVAGEDGGGDSVPIGRPVSNTRMYVLDENLRLAPIGAPAQLFIAGDGLARGYLNRPALTAESFIPDPFSTTPGQRLYKTGDLVRYLEGGQIEFISRVDHQVKIRGYRIELGEVEAALMEQPGVREACVVAKGEGDLKRVVGYVVYEEGGKRSAGEMKQQLRGRLPDYMAPAGIVELDEMPLSENGKVDRRKLAEREDREDVGGREYEGPRNGVEEVLAEIWEEVLGVERVSIHDDFFELGGHSLLATQLVSRIREAFRVELPLNSLFESPILADAALLILQHQASQVNDDELDRILEELEETSGDSAA